MGEGLFAPRGLYTDTHPHLTPKAHPVPASQSIQHKEPHQ